MLSNILPTVSSLDPPQDMFSTNILHLVSFFTIAPAFENILLDEV